MRFVHLADTHIRNLKYHKEYRVVFDRLYKKITKQNPDYIIHCGDIAHTKTQISPEFVEMCTSFFKNLSQIAPTYIILGNHDGNLRNSSRQDALTPIVDAINSPDLVLLKNSGETLLKDNFAINVLSVFDTDNWAKPSNSDNINIALYHGTISNCKTDAGWKIERGENDVSIFDNFDYGFLGDIHKTNQALDKEGKIRYPGSTIQQNHGETVDKGYLLWDIESKDKFTVKHYSIKNPKPFITITLTPSGRIPRNTEIQKGARLRLISENNLPLDVIRKAVEVSKSRFKPESITYLSRNAGVRGNVEEITNNLFQEDLRDLAVQEELIDEYLKDFQASDELLEKVYGLNHKYNTIVEEKEEISRNVSWKLKKLEWDNLFNYADSNSIDFQKLNGIVGILGKNFSGKSSIIDSLLYTMYNTTSKHNRKNINIINQNKDDCRGYVEIDIGSKTYSIERTSQKYKKTLKGKTTTEAKTNVDFLVVDNATGQTKELNGVTRMDTDKNIRKIFGTIEDFLLTSMASQLGSLTYINEGSTKRKEILAKFLDLEIFEYKFKLAKDEASGQRALLRRLEERNFDEDIKKARTEYAKNDTFKLKKQRQHNDLKEEIATLLKENEDLESKINSIPADIINISEVKNLLSIQKEQLISYEKEKEKLSKEFKKSKTDYDRIKELVDVFNISSLKEEQENIQEVSDKLDKIEKEILKYEEEKNRQKRKINILNDVQCGSEYSHCRFIKDAYLAKDTLNHTNMVLEKLNSFKKSKKDFLSTTELERISQNIKRYDNALVKLSEIRNHSNSLELKIERNKTNILKSENIIETLAKEKKEYEENKEIIENLESLIEENKKISDSLRNKREDLQASEKQVLELYKLNGSLEQQLNKIQSELEEFESLQEQYSAHDLFMRCMHANGISYDIIKKRLPLINDEVSKIITNIVEFEIMFVNEDSKLDILIKHPGYDPRPIDMGSGAEKTIAAMAIRLALLNVSTLPKGDIFILDEPGTALDEENMEGFIRILDMIKTQFKTVLLISHLDNLKDTVDTEIMIDKIDGFASVNC